MEAGTPQARNAEFDGEQDHKILGDLQSGISPQVQAMEQEKKKKEDEEENRQIQNTQTTKPAPKQMDIEQADADVQQPQQNTTSEQQVISQPAELPTRDLDDSDTDAAVLPSSQQDSQQMKSQAKAHNSSSHLSSHLSSEHEQSRSMNTGSITTEATTERNAQVSYEADQILLSTRDLLRKKKESIRKIEE